MGLYRALAIIFILFLAAAFIAARLEDKLQKESNYSSGVMAEYIEKIYGKLKDKIEKLKDDD